MSTALHLGAVVGGGRLATVHRGDRSGRAVAVKQALAGVPGAADALRREARVLTAASHPALVPVLDLLDDPLVPALVLGWADGGSLGDLLADGPLAAAELLHLLRPLAAGLGALHAAGVAHLDVTVENVLLAAAGPILIDPAPPGAGTPGYADPVVAAGGPPSARSDVFGLAACAHIALTGRLPRRAGGVAIGLALPQGVVAALAAGLHPEPRRRPVTPAAFVDLLEEALLGPPRRSAGPDACHPTAGTVLRPPGRPVTRAPTGPAGPARTWPFEHWQVEADATGGRRRDLATLVVAPSRRRRCRRARLLVAALAAGGLTTTLLMSTGEAWGEGAPARTSAPDSTRRPPAVRPPPTATPGGSP